MKNKLYALLKRKLFDDAFILLLSLATPFILFFWIYADTIERMNPIFLLLLGLLCLYAAIKSGAEFCQSFKDYSVYVRNDSVEEITGKVISFHIDRKNKHYHKYPVVRDDITGIELVMKMTDTKDVVEGVRYKFLYLENTKFAVIAETVWNLNEEEDWI